jgi:hypothetical protein
MVGQPFFSSMSFYLALQESQVYAKVNSHSTPLQIKAIADFLGMSTSIRKL